GILFGNQRGGFVFVYPLPLLGTFHAANQFSLSFSPEAALAYVAINVNPAWRPAQTGRFLPFDAIRNVRARGKKVTVNGELWLTAASASFARRDAEKLARLAKL